MRHLSERALHRLGRRTEPAVVIIGGLLVVASGIGHAALDEGGYPVTIAPGVTPP